MKNYDELRGCESRLRVRERIKSAASLTLGRSSEDLRETLKRSDRPRFYIPPLDPGLHSVKWKLNKVLDPAGISSPFSTIPSRELYHREKNLAKRALRKMARASREWRA